MKKTWGEKQERIIEGKAHCGRASDEPRSVTPAEKHDDAAADDVEPGLLLPQDLLQPPHLLLLPLLHGIHQTGSNARGLGSGSGQGSPLEMMCDGMRWCKSRFI